jgi:hypothetical protein
MVDILTFKPRAQRPRGPHEAPGEVVIFPGVVVERLIDEPARPVEIAVPEVRAN